MTKKIFKKMILMTLLVISFLSSDAQRPKGHRWYKGIDTPTNKWLRSQYDGSQPWSSLWNISKEEAVKMQLFNLSQSFKMAGSQKPVEAGHLYWMIENSSVETVPGGTVFTNTLVRDDGVAVSFVDTVARDGEKFFVAVVKGRKIAWAKATCLQSTVLVQGEIAPEQKTEEEPRIEETVYAQTPAPEVKVYEGDVNVEAPIVNVIDSTGDTYITNNYIQETPPQDQGWQQQPVQQQFVGGGGVFAQASIGWGQTPVCSNWGNSVYYGSRNGGGVTCGGGGSSNNQPVNVYVDVYNNNVNNNTNNNTIDIDIEEPHVYHPPTGGGPVDPGSGDPPVDGGGGLDGPIDPESRFSRNVGATRNPTQNVAYSNTTPSRNNRVVIPQQQQRNVNSNNIPAVKKNDRAVSNTSPRFVPGRNPQVQQQNTEAKPRMFASHSANERNNGGNSSGTQVRSGNSQSRNYQQRNNGNQSNYQQRTPKYQKIIPQQNTQPRQNQMGQARPVGGGNNGGSPQNGRNFQPQGGGFARR